MVKYKNIIFAILICFFLYFSFYPTIFELKQSNNLADKNREFILEHNYYWPDYNLYLSKIRQGLEDRLTALEKYTSEPHKGSLVQEFYVVLGWLGKVLNLTPNNAYLLGRIIFAPLLLAVIYLLAKYYFPSLTWQILAFLIVVVSGSFPRIYEDPSGMVRIGRFMEWWSNIDALQRITFIPHILFGQVISFYLLYKLTTHNSQLTTKKTIFLIFLGNLAGLAFPPSLITLNAVFFLIILIHVFRRNKNINFAGRTMLFEHSHRLLSTTTFVPEAQVVERTWEVRKKAMADLSKILFLIFTLPSLVYIFLITKILPWSALIDFHRTHPMMIPFDQYILGTGPIFFLGILGAVISIVKRESRFQPLIFWILATFGFAAFFSAVKDQSPLRFTQTGLFIPLGILGAYLFYQLYHLSDLSYLSHLSRSQAKATFIIILSLYILGSLYMMKVSLDWQTTWITQRIAANTPPVPYPPQAMYPLRDWMTGIRWLKNNTGNNGVVLAEITAGNYIPAYSGNTVYFGQSNTVDYERKQKEVDDFFSGKMSVNQAELFFKNGRIRYIFFSVQEKEKSGGKNLEEIYPFIKSIFTNHIATIYSPRY